MKDVVHYLDSWERFRDSCDKKAKGRCIINSSGWSKLREFHLENYLRQHENPFMFLLNVKWKSRRVFESHRMAKYYYRYLRQKAQALDIATADSLIDFPTWRNNVHHK